MHQLHTLLPLHLRPDDTAQPIPCLRSVALVIPGEPKGQARQRHRLVQTKGGRTFVHNYQPVESRNWKAVAQDHMRQAMGASQPFASPVSVEITAYFTCPPSKWRKRARRPAEWSGKKPDWDNLGKAISDAGNGVLWIDDAQIAEVTVRKVIAAQGDAPCVLVVVTELGQFAPAEAVG